VKVLDLFAGLRGWSEVFEERGHETFSVDIGTSFKVSLHANILDLNPWDMPFQPDIILASPPCEGFSVMQIGRNWNHDHTPKTDKARMAITLVEKTLEFIKELEPQFFIIENPRAKLRKMPQMQHLERRTVTYCQYGEHRMKPTDLFGEFPPSLLLNPPCKNGAPCHVAAPRGSTTGSQGMDSATSAKIPRLLSLAVCEAAERDFKEQLPCNLAA
jgi:hypothetical protein